MAVDAVERLAAGHRAAGGLQRRSAGRRRRAQQPADRPDAATLPRPDHRGRCQPGGRDVASRRQAGFPNIMEILMRAATLGASTTSKRNQSAADLYLHPPVEGFAGFGWSALERIVDIGYRHSLEHIAAWQERRATEDDEVERALQSSDHR
jgi:hypothetical protein